MTCSPGLLSSLKFLFLGWTLIGFLGIFLAKWSKLLCPLLFLIFCFKRVVHSLIKFIPTKKKKNEWCIVSAARSNQWLWFSGVMSTQISKVWPVDPEKHSSEYWKTNLKFRLGRFSLTFKLKRFLAVQSVLSLSRFSKSLILIS